MLSRVLSGAVLGIDAYLVRVEADVANGLPNFFTVGLPQNAVREAKERVVAAIKNAAAATAAAATTTRNVDLISPPRRIEPAMSAR